MHDAPLDREPVVIIAGIGTALVEIVVVALALSETIAGPVAHALAGIVAILAPVGGALVARLYAWSSVSVDEVRAEAYRVGVADGEAMGELEEPDDA